MTVVHAKRLLAESSWDALYDFLDPARPGKRASGRDADAEARLAEITRKLVYFFASRACRDAEDLAVETVLRVAARCGELGGLAAAERTPYFYGVARNVLHEWQRGEQRDWKGLEAAAHDPTLRTPPPAAASRREDEQRCLDRCLQRLSGSARRLILQYYGGEQTLRIARHRELADELGKSINALRIEVHRIRGGLRRCVVDCLQPGAAEAAAL